MKLKHFLTGVAALLTFSVSFTACGSDDDSDPTVTPTDEIVEYVDDAWVGTWKYSDFSLILTKNGMGQVKKTNSDGTTTASNFSYAYNKTKNVLNCTYYDNGASFTLKDIHLDSNGNLVVTHNFSGSDKTESGVKQTEEETPTDITYTAPEQMVGKWVFSDCTITIDKSKNGIIEYADGSNMPRTTSATDNFKSFTYTYSPSRNTLYITPRYGDKFTFKSITLSADGTTMTVTHNMNGSEKTETATKQTFAAITAEQIVGKWYSESKGSEYFNFSADGKVVLYGVEKYTGTWRTDGKSIYVTVPGIADTETEVVRYITISGDVMKAQVYTWTGTWQPYEVTRMDDGSNSVV